MDKSGGPETFLKPHDQPGETHSKKRRHSHSSEKNKDHVESLSPKWEQSVVELVCVHADDSNSSRTGVIIGGRKVVANAHSVQNCTQQVMLKKVDSDDEFVARVLSIGNECDLVLLTIDDGKFWKGVSPVEFGSLPTLLDAVTVVGYPKDKDTLSVTSAVASCIGMRSYVQGYTELLYLKINAAVDLQNCSGPAFNDQGQCVGISLQSFKDKYSEKNGYLIPSPIVVHFINDYEKSKEYTGFPVLGVEWQNMESPYLRDTMGMTSKQEGIRVMRVDPTDLASQYLKPSDIILKFDGVRIANDGTVPFSPWGRISFSYLVTQKYTGDTAFIKVLRDSEVHKFNIKLRSHKSLISCVIQGLPLSYYIVGGLVFTTVYVPYFYPKDSDELLDSLPNSADEQIVVISQVLEAEINAGYKNITNTRVLTFNDKPIKNLKGLVNLMDKCYKKFLKFNLENYKIIIFKTETAKAATLDILAKNNIPSALSDDLKS